MMMKSTTNPPTQPTNNHLTNQQPLTGRPQEEEGCNGSVGVLHACTTALDGLSHCSDRLVLPNDAAV